MQFLITLVALQILLILYLLVKNSYDRELVKWYEDFIFKWSKEEADLMEEEEDE